MDMIGDEMPAMQLKKHLPDDLDQFSKRIIESIQKLYKAGIVHGDLSEFNILNYNEKPYFIDFSQGTSVKDPNSKELLRRDIENLVRFFKKYNYKIDKEKEISKILK